MRYTREQAEDIAKIARTYCGVMKEAENLQYILDSSQPEVLKKRSSMLFFAKSIPKYESIIPEEVKKILEPDLGRVLGLSEDRS